MEPTYEIYLSSDGKHTVHIRADGETELVKAYNVASRMYKKILEQHGAGTKQAKAIEKEEKESKLGNCDRCGAPMSWSQRTNKAYCSALCWKK